MQYASRSMHAGYSLALMLEAASKAYAPAIPEGMRP